MCNSRIHHHVYKKLLKCPIRCKIDSFHKTTHNFLKLSSIFLYSLPHYSMFSPLFSLWTKFFTNFLFPMHGIYYVTTTSSSFISLYKYYMARNKTKIKPFITSLFISSCHLLFLMSRIWAHSLHSSLLSSIYSLWHFNTTDRVSESGRNRLILGKVKNLLKCILNSVPTS
jgi:hypothetical protein